MILGSHNSWSFLKVKEWYLKPFFWVAKCQNKTIAEQYKLGVRYFDLRLKYNYKTGDFEPAHGLVTFKVEKVTHWFIRNLQSLNHCAHTKGEKIYVRVLLETKYPDETEKKKFADLCAMMEDCFTSINFVGGFMCRQWGTYVYRFKAKDVTLDDKYSSVIPPKIRGIFPWLYARLHNHENIEKGTDKDVLFIDFVDIA